MRLTLRAVLGGLGVGLALTSCTGDTIKPYEPVTDPEQLYMRLAFDHGAVTLSTTAPYNTFQVTATPLDGHGAPMTELPAPTYTSNDSTFVTVSPTGVLTAVRATTSANGVAVIAELTGPGNVRHVDTVLVNVNATTDPLPAPATFTIHPSDSAAVAMFSTIIGSSDVYLGYIYISNWVFTSLWTQSGYYNFEPSLRAYFRASTAGGTDITSALMIEYLSLDSTVAVVDRRSGKISALRPGKVRLVARTVAYGVPTADTAEFTMTPPVWQGVLVHDRGANQSIFGPAVYIRPYGVVYWSNDQPSTIGVVFDGPADVVVPPASICDAATQNLVFPDAAACDADFTVDSAGRRIRQFPTAGVYTYRDTLSGATGTVVVTDSVPSGL